MERLQIGRGPFDEALETATGDTFEVFPVTSRTAIAKALRGKTVDFVVSVPAEHVVINTLTDDSPLIGPGRPDHHCTIVVRADSGINAPCDLKGKNVAFGDIWSTSNMLRPLQVPADHGVDTINFGAPNPVRGGSHIGSLTAGGVVEAGHCDALASDGYDPAMLAAVARLDHERRADRATLWSLVSSGPARAMHLSDRGEIASGKRADPVLVDWPEAHRPAIRRTWVAGRCAYRAQAAGQAR